MFDGGALRADLTSATAIRDQAAFRDVETSPSATDNLAAQNARVVARLAVLRRSLTLVRKRHTKGYWTRGAHPRRG